jgi:hypothetical protein
MVGVEGSCRRPSVTTHTTHTHLLALISLRHKMANNLFDESNFEGSNVPLHLRKEIIYYVKFIRIPHPDTSFASVVDCCTPNYFGVQNRGIRARAGRLRENLIRSWDFHNKTPEVINTTATDARQVAAAHKLLYPEDFNDKKMSSSASSTSSSDDDVSLSPPPARDNRRHSMPSQRKPPRCNR